MLLLLSIAGAAALAVIAYTQLRSHDPHAAATATQAAHELAAIVVVISKAIEGVLAVLQPPIRGRLTYPHLGPDYDDYEDLR